MSVTGTDQRRTNTRAQIRTVAIELFAEQGYDKTSLREIAERLGVTKAAVYYHFRTKEEIVKSVFDDQIVGMDELLEWAEAQPRGVERTCGVLERYSQLCAGSSASPNLVRFLQENQTTFKSLGAGEAMRDRFTKLAHVLAPEDASIADLLRTRLALIGMHFGAFAKDELPGSPEERSAAALSVAKGLLGVD